MDKSRRISEVRHLSDIKKNADTYGLEYTTKLQDEVRRASGRNDIPVETAAVEEEYGESGRKTVHWEIK